MTVNDDFLNFILLLFFILFNFLYAGKELIWSDWFGLFHLKGKCTVKQEEIVLSLLLDGYWYTYVDFFHNFKEIKLEGVEEKRDLLVW